MLYTLFRWHFIPEALSQIESLQQLATELWQHNVTFQCGLQINLWES